MNGNLTPAQQRALSKLTGKAKASARALFATQNGNSGSGGRDGSDPGRKKRKTAASRRQATSGGRGAVRGSVHAKALNPFDQTVPGYQLNPMSEMTIKRRLIGDITLNVSPANLSLAPGYSYNIFEGNADQFGRTVYFDDAGVVTVEQRTWSGRLTYPDCVVRAANMGIEVSFTGLEAWTTGSVAFLFVESDRTTTLASPQALKNAVDAVFAHPRALPMTCRQLATGTAKIVFPIEDRIRYESWKGIVSPDNVPDTNMVTADTTSAAGQNFGFRTLVMATRNVATIKMDETFVPPTFRVRVLSDVEYRGPHQTIEGSTTPGAELQRYHATPSPKVGPGVATQIMDSVGHFAGIVGEVLSHPLIRGSLLPAIAA